MEQYWKDVIAAVREKLGDQTWDDDHYTKQSSTFGDMAVEAFNQGRTVNDLAGEIVAEEFLRRLIHLPPCKAGQ